MFSKGRSVGVATSELYFSTQNEQIARFFTRRNDLDMFWSPNIDIYNLNLRFVDLGGTLPILVYPAIGIRPAAPDWSVAICDVELCMSPISTSENCKSSLAWNQPSPMRWENIFQLITTFIKIYDLSPHNVCLAGAGNNFLWWLTVWSLSQSIQDTLKCYCLNIV